MACRFLEQMNQLFFFSKRLAQSDYHAAKIFIYLYSYTWHILFSFVALTNKYGNIFFKHLAPPPRCDDYKLESAFFSLIFFSLKIQNSKKFFFLLLLFLFNLFHVFLWMASFLLYEISVVFPSHLSSHRFLLSLSSYFDTLSLKFSSISWIFLYAF